MAVFTPIPRPSERTTTILSSGAFLRLRNAKRMRPMDPPGVILPLDERLVTRLGSARTPACPVETRLDTLPDPNIYHENMESVAAALETLSAVDQNIMDLEKQYLLQNYARFP